MGVGCRGRRGGAGRRRRARAHQRRRHHHRAHHTRVHHHHHHRNHHGPHRIVFRATAFNSAFSRRGGQHRANQSHGTVIHIGGSGAATQHVSPFKPLFFFGVFLTLPGTINTCISGALTISTLLIVGACLLGAGNLMIVIATILSFKHEWKHKYPGYNSANWNERVRNDAKAVAFIWLVVGLALACTGFSQYSSHPLAIAGCCIIGLAELVLLFGVILGRCLKFSEDEGVGSSGNTPPPNRTASGTTVPPAVEGEEANPDPPPNLSTNPSASNDHLSTASSEDSATYSALRNDLQTIGLTLFLPGICFSCIGWIRYYDRIVAGILGATLITVGGSLILISAIILFRSTTEASKRQSAFKKILVMCFVSGIVMTPVGFTHLPPGYALGVTGACLLSLAVLSCLIVKCCYKQEETPEAENANRQFVTTINVEGGNVSMPTFQTVNVDGHPVSIPASGPNANVFVSGYPPAPVNQGTNVPYPPAGTYPPGVGANPAYPPGAGANPAYPPGAGANLAYPPDAGTYSAYPTSNVPGNATGDLPTYTDSVHMLTPDFKAGTTTDAHGNT